MFYKCLMAKNPQTIRMWPTYFAAGMMGLSALATATGTVISAIASSLPDEDLVDAKQRVITAYTTQSERNAVLMPRLDLVTEQWKLAEGQYCKESTCVPLTEAHLKAVKNPEGIKLIERERANGTLIVHAPESVLR